MRKPIYILIFEEEVVEIVIRSFVTHTTNMERTTVR